MERPLLPARSVPSKFQRFLHSRDACPAGMHWIARGKHRSLVSAWDAASRHQRWREWFAFQIVDHFAQRDCSPLVYAELFEAWRNAASGWVDDPVTLRAAVLSTWRKVRV